MLLGTLGASLLGNLLAGKGIIRQGKEEFEPKEKMNLNLMVYIQEIIYLK